MLRLSGVQKNYGKKAVLRDISMEADAGELIIISGDNGSGKSTLLEIIAGAIKESEGSIFPDVKTRRGFGYVPQENPLFDELSVIRNLSFFLRRDKSLIRETVEKFALKDILKQPVGTLSGGQKRRLALAIGLSGNPEHLLLDEPTTALDFTYQSIIDGMLTEYVAGGGSLIMTSHNSDEVRLATRILRLQDGVLTDAF